jgi:hypothetical protein
VPVFAILAAGEQSSLQTMMLEAAINVSFPENNLKVTAGQWLICTANNTLEIMEKVGGVNHLNGNLLVLRVHDFLGLTSPVLSYSGWHDQRIWDWISARSKAEQIPTPSVAVAVGVDTCGTFFNSLETPGINGFSVSVEKEGPKLADQIKALSSQDSVKFLTNWQKQLVRVEPAAREQLLSDPTLKRIASGTAFGSDPTLKRIASGAAVGSVGGLAVAGIISSLTQSINNPFVFAISFMALGGVVGGLGGAADKCDLHLKGPSVKLPDGLHGASLDLLGLDCKMVFTRASS